MAGVTSGQHLAVVARFSLDELNEIELLDTILAVHMPVLLLETMHRCGEAQPLRCFLFSICRPRGVHDEVSGMIGRW
jgi:hypothetical protein